MATPHPEVDAFFNELSDNLSRIADPPPSVRGLYQFVVAGHSAWVVDLRKGAARVARTREAHPDATVEYASADLFNKVSKGQVSLKWAFISKQIVVTGNMEMVFNLIKLFEQASQRAAEEHKREALSRARQDSMLLTPSYEGGGSAPPSPGATRSSDLRARRGSALSSTSSAVPWVPDAMVAACSSCAVAFTFMTRKHHCRSCGGIFCDRCAPKRAPANARVCNHCFAQFYALPSPRHVTSRSPAAATMHAGPAGPAHTAYGTPGSSRGTNALRTPQSSAGGGGGGGGVLAAGAVMGRTSAPSSPAFGAAPPVAASVSATGASPLLRAAASSTLARSASARNSNPNGGAGGGGSSSPTLSAAGRRDSRADLFDGLGDSASEVDGLADEAPGLVDVPDTEAAPGVAIAERLGELEQRIQTIGRAAATATLPEALPPTMEEAITHSELAAVVVMPIIYVLSMLGWRTVPVICVSFGVIGWRMDLLHWFWALIWCAAGLMLWHASTDPSWETTRRRVRIFGVALVMFLDYRVVEHRIADMAKDDQSAIWAVAHRRNAARALVIMRNLRGLWVKMGQYLSSRPDIMPDQYIDQFSTLQDSMPARPLSEVRTTIEEDLGKPVDSLFARLDDEALAAASIGQVHRGILQDGLEVAVKVKHRTIDTTLEHDLANLDVLMKWVGWAEPRFDVKSVMDEWSKEVRRELDFKNEAENMLEVRSNMIRDGLPVVIPRVPPGAFGRRVLVMRFVDGIKASSPLHELERLGVDREAVCRAVLRAFAHQIYVNGLFNGDPHPGNIMIIRRGDLREADSTDVEEQRAAAVARTTAGVVPAAGCLPTRVSVMDGDADDWVPVLLDFGLTKRLPEAIRLAFCKMAVAGEEVDYAMLLEAFDEMGMRFSKENIVEDMENMRHMFRDAVPKAEARQLAQEKAKRDEAKRKEASEKKGEKRSVDAWPTELILFLRASELLQGLCSALEIRMPVLQIMGAAARVALLRRFPTPRRTPQPTPEVTAPRRLRLNPGGLTASRGIDPTLLRSPMPGLPTPSPSPASLESAIRRALNELRHARGLLGAQVAVFKDGVLVADVAQGQLGALDHRRVAPDSLFPIFGLGRLAIAALLYGRNDGSTRQRTRTRVAEHWPHFAQRGKGGCTIAELLRCRSGVEGWLPEDMGLSRLDADNVRACVEEVAAADPRLLRGLVLGAHAEGPPATASSSEDLEVEITADAGPAPVVRTASASTMSAGLPDTAAARARSTSGMLSSPSQLVRRMSSGEDLASGVVQGPDERQEQCAHLFFGWGWAASGLATSITGTPSVRDAVREALTAPLGIADELLVGAAPVGESSSGPSSSDAPCIASIQLASEDEAFGVRQSAIAIGGGGAAGADDSASTVVGGGGGEDDGPRGEDEVDENVHVLRTVMAAVEFHESLTAAGLSDLESLMSGGREHLVDPRIVNARRIRESALPSINVLASARALACIGASLMERLILATEGRRYAAPAPTAASRAGRPLVGAAAAEACREMGFRLCPFVAPGAVPGTVDNRGFAMGGLGGSILVCDPHNRIAVAITVNKLFPRRRQTHRILRAVFDSLGVGIPREAMVNEA